MRRQEVRRWDPPANLRKEPYGVEGVPNFRDTPSGCTIFDAWHKR